MATLTGTTLGKYQILERLGRGGMADVYKAHHTRLDRDVAIKVLHPHLIEGQDFLSRFEREAKAVASLKHPHIVQVFDFDSQDDLHYIVMELVGGGSLRSRFEELARVGARMPQTETVRILTDVALAIDFAHGRGMLHRDVKPANILLENDGDAFLSDFGIARILSDTQFTTTGALIGTPHYMSPEQGKGLPLTQATDLYSLGVVVYEMLTGRAPYDSDTPLGVIHKHIYEPLPSPRLTCPDLPPAAEDMLLKSLAKEPADRYPSAGEMLRALKDGLASAEDMAVPRPAPAPQSTQGVPEAVARGIAADRPTPPPVVPTPVQPTLSGMQTVAMEDQPTGSPPACGAPPSPARSDLPGARQRRGARVGRTLLGLALVAAIGVAMAVALPRVLPGATTSPATPTLVRSSPDSGQCIKLADCLVQAAAAMQTQRYAAAVGFYSRANYLVPQEEHPAYAHLWCEMAQANLALGHQDLALDGFERCIDWTQGEPGGLELRTQAEDQVRALSGQPFADRVTDYRPGGQPNGACTDPDAALGAPDFDPEQFGTFLCLGSMGYVELEFVAVAIVDGPGPDLLVHGDPDMNDTWRIKVSEDGVSWANFGPQPEVVELDLATVGMARIRWIRIEDAGTGGSQAFAGSELDAVEALHWDPAS